MLQLHFQHLLLTWNIIVKCNPSKMTICTNILLYYDLMVFSGGIFRCESGQNLTNDVSVYL